MFMLKRKNNKEFTSTPFQKKGVGSQGKRGFTIIELIVSIGLFIVVSIVGVGALLSIVGVNKKPQAVKSVINNISFAVEGMSKTLRVGTTYHCEQVVRQFVPSDLNTPRDCASGGNFLAFEASGGEEANSNDQIIYRLNENQIERSTDGGSTFVGVTAPEVQITADTGLRFYVLGTGVSDNLQPRVIITVGGVVNLSDKTKTDFNIQTSVSQRKVDS